MNIYQIIHIDELSATPKYLQLANSIINGVDAGSLDQDLLLPSINELSYELEISRDTAEKAYKHLKKQQFLESVPGKGYYIKKKVKGPQFRVFLLFNKLSAHKKIIFDALSNELGEQATIDLYVYNNDFSLFKKIISQRRTDYTHYVIIPHFSENGEKAAEVINSLPLDKVILLDKLVAGLEGPHGAVYENFEEDIYTSLQKAKEALSKYEVIKIVFPEYTYYPVDILKGFYHFCHEYAFTPRVVHEIEKEDIQKGEVYISLMENDLVTLVEKIVAKGLKVGSEVGVISYNETPLKKIILKGITTISTDFQKKGVMTAKMIQSHQHEKIAVPFLLTIRPSI